MLQRIQELQNEVETQKKANSILEYKEKINQETEAGYREEIEKLRRQLDSSHVGRTAESELFLEKSSDLKRAEEVFWMTVHALLMIPHAVPY